MKIIIDGYNLIWAAPELRKKVLKEVKGINLAEGRKALLHFLDLYQRGHPKLDITVVFDGKEEVFPFPSLHQRIKAFYTKGETADSLIKRIVEDEKKPQEILVVTSDKELKGRVKERGAQVIGSLNFFKRISPAKKRSPKGLSSRQENLIKEELKRTYKIE
ncbi:MAG: NYN domain-containing protein [Candidatus Omnitrophica bacterium]|nr:NYN domain-containing protein [Candidatus Omnitrophota bacterium]